MMGCGFPDHEQGYKRRPQRSAAVRDRPSCPSGHGSAASAHRRYRRSRWRFTRSRRAKAISTSRRAWSACRGARRSVPATNPRIDGTNGTGYNVYIPMGLTAENVAARCKVSRESQDEWAALSQQQRACAARDSRGFDREIVGVDIPEVHDAGGDVVAAHTVTRDDGPREGTTVEALAKLKPMFKNPVAA